MNFKKILREPLFYLLPLLAALYLIIIPAKMEISNIKLTRNEKTENIKLPYSVGMGDKEVFFVSYDLAVKNKKTAKFNITPDDCLQEILINGEKFPLDSIKGLCDYTGGAYLDFSKYVQEGLNHFELRAMNNGGPGGLRIEIPYNGFKSLSLMHYIFTLVFLLSTALLLRKFRFKFIAVSIVLLGIVVRLILYTYVGPTQYSYDTGGHLDYMQIISEEKRLPKNDECWSCYHPPLYYTAFAVLKNIADRYDLSFSNRILQQAHLLLSFASIIFGVALILNLFGNCRIAYLAALISVLWPGFVIAAPRIGNDSLFYFGALFCMLFAQRYWRLHKNSDILLASIGASIALAAKATGFVILGVWVVIYIFGAMRYFKIGSLKTLFASIFVVALFIGFSNYRTVINILDNEKTSLVGNSNGLNPSLRVDNKIGNYLYFDLQDYMLEPYASAWNDKGGRKFYWNYSLKTSLFGEFKFWNSQAGNIIATIISLLALLISILALWGIIHAKFRDLPPLFFVIFLFAAHIYLRVSYPYSCSNDFRYIFPVIFPLAYFAASGAQILENSRLRKLSCISMLAFAALSLALTVGQAV
ncbi:hypothetical protein R83H12_02458 [Fibrobacteria bacterium R8-3-H12]